MILLLYKVRVELLRVGAEVVVDVVVADVLLHFMCIQRVANVIVDVVTHIPPTIPAVF
jgi:hypothetical protein